ncbi:hypothetical protein pdam_00022906 [Pocillopora damicornis]|uniref:Fibrinogen C-terminal domain-containing protein n=1 Tax=Pocillopora damicornis TaxID=46731 RepID=A0A3M6TCZ7_POCDA|nr:hypothetical protein pdam_00022906 [Pocillopora damicornis]
MKELRRHLSFTQLRFHCRKKQGRTFHVVTASNSSGEAVVRYFSGQTDEQPDACVGSNLDISNVMCPLEENVAVVADQGDGEYWINPEKSGNPLRVYFDMERYGGGWLLVSNVKFGSPSPKVSVETSYRGIGGCLLVSNVKFGSPSPKVSVETSYHGIAETDFHCQKKQGRTFHMVTASNSSGEPVVQYFSGQTGEQLDACGSFVRLKMRGHLVGFHFCPILLSGVALFFVAFSSSLHTDLSTDEVFERVEGGWLLVSNVKFGSPSPKVSVEKSYGGIAETDFHCHKKQGRTFHVVTASNSSGELVVQYFSGQTDEQPDASGSFVRLNLTPNHDKRGWDSAHPAFSCKEILDSGHSKGDGEYWIDPEKSGNHMRVNCDMSRYGGK